MKIAFKLILVLPKESSTVPKGKGLKVPKGLNEKMLKDSHVGIIEFDGENIKLVKRCKKNPYNIRKEILLHSLATQQYKGGMRMFNSYK